MWQRVALLLLILSVMSQPKSRVAFEAAKEAK
jgi:hypothetical protein